MRNSTVIQNVQREPAMMLLIRKYIDDIQGIFVILHDHLESIVTLSQVERDMVRDIHRGFSNQKVWIVSHEFSYQYGAESRYYHIKYADGGDFLEMFFVYRGDSKIRLAMVHKSAIHNQIIQYFF